MVVIDPEKPWFGTYESYVRSCDLREPQEKKWAYQLARNEYRIEHNPWLKPLFRAGRWGIATGFIGNFNDPIATRLAPITGYSKKHNQDWNAALWSSIGEVAVLYGGYEVLSSPDIIPDEFVTFGTKLLFFAAQGFSAYNLGRNAYRLANRDDQARASHGYMSIASHFAYHLKSESASIIDEYRWRARTRGTSTVYAGLESMVENARNELSSCSKAVAGLASFFLQR